MTIEDLEAWPLLYRYEPGRDGFGDREGAFVPASWWAVAALAATGRVDEARERADALCALLRRLMAEEVDPESGAALGNVPLVWSHIEAARALYILDAAELRRRYGRPGCGRGGSGGSYGCGGGRLTPRIAGPGGPRALADRPIYARCRAMTEAPPAFVRNTGHERWSVDTNAQATSRAGPW